MPKKKTATRNSQMEAMLMDIGIIYVDIKNCQRCGHDHSGMEFKRLINPADKFTYYGSCPNIRQPVLLAMKELVIEKESDEVKQPSTETTPKTED